MGRPISANLVTLEQDQQAVSKTHDLGRFKRVGRPLRAADRIDLPYPRQAWKKRDIDLRILSTKTPGIWIPPGDRVLDSNAVGLTRAGLRCRPNNLQYR